MQDVDLVILNAGIGFINPELDWEKDKKTIDTNVTGFCSIANIFMKHFLLKGNGHLVGISSIAALRGSGVYSASKAFISNYLEGLRHKVVKEKKQIVITDIKPGFVDTNMAKGKVFWMTSANKAANLIYKAIEKKKYHAYITPKWRLVAWLLKCMPKFIYDRIF